MEKCARPYYEKGHNFLMLQYPLDPLEVYVNGEPIKCTQIVKYLGIMVHENLIWNEQNKKLKGKIKNALSSLRKLKNILPQSKLHHYQVYTALFEDI